MSFIGLINKKIVTVTIISATVVLLQSVTFGQNLPEQSTFTLTDRENSDFILAKYSVDRFESSDYSYANTLKHRNQERKSLRFSQELKKMMEDSPLYYGVEYSNWKMRRRDLDFAVTHSGTALAIGSGEIKELSFDRDDNFKAFMGFKLDDGWKAGFVYSNYRTSQSMAVESQLAGSLFATRSHPKYNEEAFNAEIAAIFESNVFDAEVRGDINFSDRASITVFGGFRWMDVTQSVVTAYDGLDFNQGLITQQNQSDLFGLRLGGVGSFNISDDFYLFGSLEATIAYGDHAVSLNEMDNEFGTQDVLVDVQDTYGQGHLLSAAAFGVGWEFAGGCDLKLGYEINYWGGLADRLVFLDDTHEAMFSHETEDILMDGFFVRLSRDY
ncbi:MAG: hypothetical protein CMJ76_08500 [Planctomycetaceae bacterium]|nr:hypothetical protein [Planctomycetaceae bacterium]